DARHVHEPRVLSERVVRPRAAEELVVVDRGDRRAEAIEAVAERGRHVGEPAPRSSTVAPERAHDARTGRAEVIATRADDGEVAEHVDVDAEAEGRAAALAVQRRLVAPHAVRVA